MADDQTLVERREAGLVARVPASIAGLLEVRGLGIVQLPYVEEVALRLVVVTTPPQSIERLPTPESRELLGVTVPVLRLDPLPFPLRPRCVLPSPASLDHNAAAMSGQALSMTRDNDPSDTGRAVESRPDFDGEQDDRPRVVIVTGLSGAGRTTALRALEDLGYEAVDNPPLALLAGLLHADAPAPRPMVIGIDVRTRDFATPRRWPCSTASRPRAAGASRSSF